MGGSSYGGRSVGRSSSSRGFSSGGTSSSSAKSALSRYSAHEDTDPSKKRVSTDSKNPIVIALDVTGSNSEFSRIVYDKAPMLHGQIEQQGYLKEFAICFTAVGDAYTDAAPLQVCDFGYGNMLDKELKKLFLEGCGGGQRMETYELAAHYFNTKCDMKNAEMPFFFFIGDEAPYPTLETRIVNHVIGSSMKQSQKSRTVFSKLYKKFQDNVFFLQNPYCGHRGSEGIRHTDAIRNEWIDCIGLDNAEKILPIHEEKSVVDVILGTIAMVNRARDMGAYVKDMKDRGQTSGRINNVKRSLGGLESAVVKKGKLPKKKGKSRKSGGMKL